MKRGCHGSIRWGAVAVLAIAWLATSCGSPGPRTVRYETRSSYQVGRVGAPGALAVQPAVLDFALDTRQLAGGEWSLGGLVGEMTLVLDVRDAASGQPLARFVERPDLRLQTGTGGVAVQGPGPVWSLVRRAVARWAQLSREELDALQQATIPPLPGPR